MRASTRRRRPRLALLCVLCALWLFAACGPALAHASLVGSFPAEQDTLSEPPEQVRLRFDEPVEAAFDPLRVYDPRGERVDAGNARVSPEDVRVLVVDLEAPRVREGAYENGWRAAYRVDYRVTSVDGHVLADTHNFTVTNGASGSFSRTPGDGTGTPNAAAAPAAAAQGAPRGFGHVPPYGAISLGIVGAVVLAVPILGAARRRDSGRR